MAESSDGQVVKYTVKEILARMDAKLEEISKRLDESVTRTEFEKLAQEVDRQKSDIDHLKETQQTECAVKEAIENHDRQRMMSIAKVIAMVQGILGVTLIVLHEAADHLFGG